MQTLWNKGVEAAKAVEDFTVGNDREMDLRLAKYDVLGSKAHIAMLAQVGLLPKDEEQLLQKELDNILGQIEKGEFVLEDLAEDIHSQVEINLKAQSGFEVDTDKLPSKIHVYVTVRKQDRKKDGTYEVRVRPTRDVQLPDSRFKVDRIVSPADGMLKLALLRPD